MLYLFSILVEKHGSISEAARKCSIARRSYYTLRDRDFLQPETKEKILSAAFNISPDETLDYLLKRHVDDSLEVLSTNLSKLYEDAVEESDRETLKGILEHFNQVKQEYEGLIINNLQREVLDQLAHLKEKAVIAEILWNPAESTLFKKQDLMTIIPLITKELDAGVKTEMVSEKYGISQDLVSTITKIRRKEIVISLNEVEGYLLGLRKQSESHDHWTHQGDTAAGTEVPSAVYYGAPSPEYQTPTAPATSNTVKVR